MMHHSAVALCLGCTLILSKYGELGIGSLDRESIRLPVDPSPSLGYAAQADPTDCLVEQTKHFDVRLGMGTDGWNDWSGIHFL